MSWPQWEDIGVGHPDLASERLIPIRDALLGEAVQTVRDDLNGKYDVANMERNGVPPQVARLAVYKARDLGYVAVWGGEPPAGTSAPEWRRRYAELLADVRANSSGDLAQYLRDVGGGVVRFV